MKMKTIIIGVLFFGFLLSNAHAAHISEADRTQRVAFLRPDKNSPFWDLMEDVMRAAAEDLDVILDVYYGHNDNFRMVQIVHKLSTSPAKPDIVIFSPMGNTALQIVRILDEEKIDVFTINAEMTLPHHEKDVIPRQKYKHWIGQILPNDIEGGRKIAEYLYKTAKTKMLMHDGIVRLSGIEGSHRHIPSKKRLKGLYNVVNKYDTLVLNDVGEGHWISEASYIATEKLLDAYPKTNVMWVANDLAAIGSVKAIEAHGLTSGKDIIVASIDWLPEVFDYIREGKIEASFGGHFMDGAWALILAYDYKNGHDFVNSPDVNMYSSWQIINRENVNLYGSKLEAQDWNSIDFKALSKSHNPQLQNYNFNVLDLLR